MVQVIAVAWPAAKGVFGSLLTRTCTTSFYIHESKLSYNLHIHRVMYKYIYICSYICVIVFKRKLQERGTEQLYDRSAGRLASRNALCNRGWVVMARVVTMDRPALRNSARLNLCVYVATEYRANFSRGPEKVQKEREEERRKEKVRWRWTCQNPAVFYNAIFIPGRLNSESNKCRNIIDLLCI